MPEKKEREKGIGNLIWNGKLVIQITRAMLFLSFSQESHNKERARAREHLAGAGNIVVPFCRVTNKLGTSKR
jgi:hypothetical protein